MFELPLPQSAANAARPVFEHLADAELADAASLERMSIEQQLLFAIEMLRDEVGSGGFDTYFRYSGGNTALQAKAAALLLGQPWVDLITEACDLLGDPYPIDIDVREVAVDELDGAELNRLSNLLYDLEANHPADELLDEYVWSHHASFFRA